GLGAVALRRDPQLAAQALGDALERPELRRHARHRHQRLPRIARLAAGPVVAVDEDRRRLEAEVLLEHGDRLLQPLRREDMVAVRLDDAMARELGAQHLTLLEPRSLRP